MAPDDHVHRTSQTPSVRNSRSDHWWQRCQSCGTPSTVIRVSRPRLGVSPTLRPMSRHMTALWCWHYWEPENITACHHPFCSFYGKFLTHKRSLERAATSFFVHACKGPSYNRDAAASSSTLNLWLWMVLLWGCCASHMLGDKSNAMCLSWC